MIAPADRSLPRADAGLLVALYALEVAALLAALAFNRYYNFFGDLTVQRAIVLIVPVALSLASCSYVVFRYRRLRRIDARQFTFTLAANLIAIALLLAAGELVVRAFSVRAPTGRSFAGTVLLPKSWDEVKARNAEVVAQANVSYLVADDVLGWVPGTNRRSADGLYSSSAEGLRSARPGISYAASPAPHRVAIVGDSYTFGLEVPFEDSWGSALEKSLGTDVTVLNLGVNGYGVDQASLRYERDGRPWRPEVAIFGFIEHDLYRSLSVYSFVTFPDWDLAFSKPRFVLTAGRLERLSDRVVSPAQILTTSSVTDLPFLGYDPGYNPDEWEQHLYDASFLIRFLLSRFPRWPAEGTGDRDNELEEINSELVVRFTRRATADGTAPVVAYFPSRGDFTGQDRSTKDRVLAALQRKGVAYLDLTSCIGAIGEEQAFIPGRPHYSAEGNAAVARCLLPAVRDRLTRR